jgi:hypothetical protein
MLVDAEFVLLTTLVRSAVLIYKNTMIFLAVKKGHHFDRIVQIMTHVKMVKGKTVRRLKSNRFHKRWGKVSGEGDSSATRCSKLVGAYRLQLQRIASSFSAAVPFASLLSANSPSLPLFHHLAKTSSPINIKGGERERERERERESNSVVLEQILLRGARI